MLQEKTVVEAPRNPKTISVTGKLINDTAETQMIKIIKQFNVQSYIKQLQWRGRSF